MTNKKCSQELLSLFEERAINLMGLANQLFFVRIINQGLSTISATEFLSRVVSQQKPKKALSIEKIEKSLHDLTNNTEWAENWVRKSFNGGVIIEEIPDLKFSDPSLYEKLDNDCRSLALLFIYFPKEQDFQKKSIKEQLSSFHTMDKKAAKLIEIGNRLLGYWIFEIQQRVQKRKNVSSRTIKRLQKEKEVKTLLEKHKGASRKMVLESMELTGLGERRVRDVIKEIRSLEPT